LCQWDKALEYFEESVRLSDRTGEAWRQAAAAINLGEIYRPKGELAQAIACYEQARQIGSEFGFDELVGLALMNLGAVYLKKGAIAEARGYLEESLSLYHQTGAEVHLPEVLRYLAELHLQRGQPDEALPLAQEALERAVTAEHLLEMGQTYRVLGQTEVALDRLAGAEANLMESLARLEDLNNPYELGLTLVELARLRRKQTKAEQDNEPLRQQGLQFCDRAIDIFERLGARLDLKLAADIKLTLGGIGGEP
jgi:tetratricopeptide (TPR) repeat protein